MLKIGSHIKFKSPDYLVSASKESIKNKANSMMIYLGPPQSSKRVDMEKYKLKKYMLEFSHKIKPENIIVHAPYITNLANLEKKDFAIEFLLQEIKRMNYIGAKHLVIHPGAYTKFDKQDSINCLINSLKYIFSKTKFIEISLETMSGKGTEIGTTFKELKYIVDNVNSDRLNICLDTCHVWDSGVNIKDINFLIKELKKYDLLKLVKVIHLNDSKNDIGSSKDRHSNLGKGFIGLDILKKIVHHKEFKNAIKILETPWVEGKPIYNKEIEMIK